MKRTTKGLTVALCFCMIFSSVAVVAVAKPRSPPLEWMTIEPLSIDVTVGIHISGDHTNLGSWYDGDVMIIGILPVMSMVLEAEFQNNFYTYYMRVAVDAPSCTGNHFALFVYYKGEPYPTYIGSFNSRQSGYDSFVIGDFIDKAVIMHTWHIPLWQDPWEFFVKIFVQRCLVPV